MDLGVTTQGLVLLALALIASGFVMGFLAGLFGIGGGAILVPALYEAFRAIGIEQSVLMHLCLGTSLAVMIPTTITSFRSHRARGTVDEAFLRRVAPWIVAGVVVGALIARVAPSRTLQWIWALCGGTLALKMALSRDEWKIADDVPRSWTTEIVALLIGLASTLMSIGGASIMVAFMTLYGRPLLPSVSTSSGLGPLIAIPGAIGFVWAGWGTSGLPPFSLGFVSLIGAALIIPVSVYAAPIGVRVGHGMEKRKLEVAFAVFLGIMSLRFLLGALFE
jgi:uncharacterized membrane protein YfcA